ncbi:ADP-ribose pyrophosphatase [uncultured bacterium]|nr:ADP-ribose pyrophosphatase [uncultured bacterium]
MPGKIKTKPHIEVACAIIERGGLVLAAQRSESMSMPLKWEFPGGKIHVGESSEECLVRELLEELDVLVTVKYPLKPVTWEYAGFSVTLHPFVCAIKKGAIVIHEHKAVKWLTPAELPTLDWAEADFPVISEYLSLKSGGDSK